MSEKPYAEEEIEALARFECGVDGDDLDGNRAYVVDALGGDDRPWSPRIRAAARLMHDAEERGRRHARGRQDALMKEANAEGFREGAADMRERAAVEAFEYLKHAEGFDDQGIPRICSDAIRALPLAAESAEPAAKEPV